MSAAYFIAIIKSTGLHSTLIDFFSLFKKIILNIMFEKSKIHEYYANIIVGFFKLLLFKMHLESLIAYVFQFEYPYFN